MKKIIYTFILLLTASVILADPPEYVIVAMPAESLTAGVQSKLDAAIRRFSVFTNDTDSMGGWVTWCQENNTNKIWVVNSIAIAHLRFHPLDRLSEAKLADLKNRLDDFRIRLEFVDDVVSACTNAGLKKVEVKPSHMP